LLERQAQQMRQPIDDLLDISRIAGGALQLHRERIDLRLVVDHAIQTLSPEIKARKHRLATEAPKAPVWLRADACRLEQVFVNLIGNSVKYTDPGGELTVRIHTRKREALIRVRDSGIGMAPNVQQNVFEIFKQANPSDARSRSGLGIGLAVVRHLVQLHHGSVSAASGGVDQGSEFTVRLPREN
jgi:two-component system CheB/CheR fusion protein